MNSLLLDPSGTPLGVVAQTLWVRPEQPRGRLDTKALPIEEKETRCWLDAAEAVRTGARAAGFSGQLWLQYDAGANAREVLEWCAWEPALWVTVRCRCERNVLWPEEGKLEEVLGRQPVLGQMKVWVARHGRRGARRAVVSVRAAEVVLPLRNPQSGVVQPVGMYAVWGREEGERRDGEAPIDWLLLTTRPVVGFGGARAVVKAYAQRWRVEETYKTWKSGGCQVEKSQLGYRAFQAWQFVLLCVAVRVERLKRLARTQPELPASSEFSELELEALSVKRQMNRRPVKPPDTLTLGEAVQWVAELGGYNGKSSGGPPGSITLARGLASLEEAVSFVRHFQTRK
jgi:hypothetical protein